MLILLRSACSVSCGTGVKRRTRGCQGGNCVGDTRQSAICNDGPCSKTDASWGGSILCFIKVYKNYKFFKRRNFNKNMLLYSNFFLFLSFLRIIFKFYVKNEGAMLHKKVVNKSSSLQNLYYNLKSIILI